MSAAKLFIRKLSTYANLRQLAQPPIRVFGLEGRYATALYSAAYKKKCLDSIEKDLNEFSNIWKSDPKLKTFLLNPLLKRELKKEAVNSVLAKKKANSLTINLFDVLVENGRFSNINGVMNSFSVIMAAVRGEVVCEVTTAKPLDAAMTKEVENALRGFLKKGEALKMSTKVDPSIMGGMVVSVGDKYVDMSILSKIKKYQELIELAV